jgi:ubiquinone/menaquinone biosynthesis C-methylase UbiE
VTREIFDQIAPGWYNFRHWSIFRSELEAMAQRWQGGKLLNLGCAHGPDFLPFKESFDLYGVDFSVVMLRFARRYAQKFHFAVNLSLVDVGYLPYSDETFDWAISVATYHHLKCKQSRQAAVNELWRILKPGGEAFVTVWNRWQPRFWFSRRQVAVPWRTQDKTMYRDYYLFSYGELESLMKQAAFQVVKSFPESSYQFPIKLFSQNICLLLKKGN